VRDQAKDDKSRRTGQWATLQRQLEAFNTQSLEEPSAEVQYVGAIDIGDSLETQSLRAVDLHNLEDHKNRVIE
jgi:hypothetical protein